MSLSNEDIVQAIKSYQERLERYVSQKNNDKILYVLGRLRSLPIRTIHLEETGVGRTVNALKKFGDVGENAKDLVAHWKIMVVQEEQAAQEAVNNEDNVDSAVESAPDSSFSENEHHHSDNVDELNNSNHYESPEDDENNSSHRLSDTYRYNDDDNTNKCTKENNKEIYNKNRDEKLKRTEDRKDRHEKDKRNDKHYSKRKRDSSSSDSEVEENSKHRSREKSHSKRKRNDSESSEEDECDRYEKKKPKNRRESSSSENNHNKYKSRADRNDRESSSSKSKSKEKSSVDKKKEERSDSKHKSESKSNKHEQEEKNSKKDKSEHKKYRHSEKEPRSEPSNFSKDDRDSNKLKTHTEKYDKEKKEKEKSKKQESVTKHHSNKEKANKVKDKDRDKSSHSKSEKEKSSSRSKHNISGSNSSFKGDKIEKKNKEKDITVQPKNKQRILHGIDSESGASFAEALGMCESIRSSKSNTKKKSLPSTSTTSEKSERSPEKTFSRSKSSKTENIDIPDEKYVPELLKDPHLEPVNINLSSLLPEISPNYRPVGFPLDNQSKKIITEDEALSKVMANKNMRTKVYSGNKTVGKVETLFVLCVRVLQDNIDALEYTGGVPYIILKPILEKATPDQLFNMEHHNPYLIEDTDELWKLHCQKEFRTKKREELESWRDMYMRCLDEREARLNAITANIKQSQEKSIPIRTAKLAYVDSVAKPPRNIARKQMKNGIVNEQKQSPTAKLAALVTSGEAGKVAVPNPGSRAVEKSSNTNSSSSSNNKPKKAPLMAKTLSFLKNRFRR